VLLARAMMPLLLLACALVLASPSVAQDAGSPMEGLPPPDASAYRSLETLEALLDRSADTVVAEVGPYKVTWGDIADEIRAMPPISGGVPFPTLYQRAAAQVMERDAVALRAETVGLDKDPAVQRRMRNASDQALATEMLRRSLAPNLTERALRATYDALVAGKAAPEEVRARLIMVPTQAEAPALIGRLHQGANFADLAHEFSKDGTAQNGGDLGFARLDMLSPEIGSVMFALAPGQITEYPIRSFGAWFIVKVEERRQPTAPTFEAARGVLAQDIIHAGAPVLMQAALKAAPVTYHGLAGKKGPDKTAGKTDGKTP
jgi:peptidyl-prolyl cis-trans isomerase C